MTPTNTMTVQTSNQWKNWSRSCWSLARIASSSVRVETEESEDSIFTKFLWIMLILGIVAVLIPLAAVITRLLGKHWF
jgi:hypothetical protein